MKRKNMARNALVTSIISLLLCVSMLVGTTFAWFTDEVVTGMNTIAAGNLDVALLADGVEVKPDTKLFNLVDAQGNDTWWEPGMVVYEKLQVANVGTLALKYQMTLNFGKENDLGGHKLSEVLKVAVLKKTDVKDWNSRSAVLDAAKAAVAADQGVGTLSNFYEIGELEAGKTSEEKYVVIFWAPNANKVDNLYNANNGQLTSDGEPLHIEFGINLQATQKMSESDSFGNDYDEPSAILPKATVNNTGAKTVKISDTETIDLDTSFQFLPNESAAEAAASEYAGWHADYVISADHKVAANSIALAGYYSFYCDNYNGGNWVMLPVTEDVPANTKVALVKLLGVTVNYELICQFGNDGKGFMCGVADLTGENTGTTITVDLVMYETYPIHHGEHTDINGEYCDGGTANCRTGVEKVIGTYTYTFGGSYVTLEDGTVLLNEYGEDGNTVLSSVANVAATEYTVPDGVDVLPGSVFAANSGITSVTVPASATDFGATGVSATGASGGAFKGSAVESVTLEEGMTEIPAAAFNGAKNLKSVSVPSTVTTVGVNAFRQTALTELTIPATVKNVKTGAFRDMTALTTVTVEGNVSFENYAFRSVPNLTSIYLLGDDVTFNGGQFATHSDNGDATGITIYVKNATVAARVYAAQDSAYGYEVKILGAAADGSDASEVTQVKNDTQLVDAIANGKAVVLTQDVSLDKIDLTDAITKDVVIDANGHTITTADAYGIEVTAGKNVTISNADVVMTKAGDYITYAAGFKIANGDYADSTITLKNCTITMANTDWAYPVNMPASVKNLNLVIDNCTLEGAIAVQCWGDNNTITITNSKLICNYTTNAMYTSYCVALQGDGTNDSENNTLVIDNCEFLYSGIDNFNSSIYAAKDVCEGNTGNTVTVTNCTYGEKVVAD